ncbi:MAG: DUF1549 and DUF1553 domain-containing protein, partial [Pirellulaceae bacterium]|nr:DUF1549 and DUF1553 domain-containing protein [Pirellulaceae bacterium]
KPDVQTDQPDALVTDADRQFWAFQPPRKPAPPELRPADMKRARRPIDRFLLRRLRQRGLTYAGEAPRLTLIRRVAFDLTGLPPEWSDVDRFLKDESDDWYAKMVDHYLDSPHYGERWARHWLDLSGYADSEGKRSADPIRQHAGRYRDYVVRAFNADKPYDRFLIEQLAGDELHDFAASESATLEVMDSLIATGFLRMAPDGTGSDIVDTVEERFEVVADEIEVLGSSVLGLTLRCAQCHTHKYDPIPQRDYYRLVAVFQGAYDVYDWLKPTSVASQSKKKNAQRRYLTHVTGEVQSEYEERKRRHDQKIAAINAEYTAARDAKRQEFLDEQLTKLPAALRDDLKTLVNTPQPQRNEVQKYLAEKFESQLTVDDAGLQKKYAELKKKQVDVDKRVKAAAADAPSRPQIRALWDRGEPSPTWIFRRGDFANPGGLVGPGVLSVLSDGKTKFSPSPRRKGSTGRRLAFAEWLTNPDHPLTSRVLVNRIWYHHFGRGIVESLANFGKTGTSPTHPELLDWLAVSFVENGWSMKWLHRQIMLSAAYRQSSELPPAAEKSDPGNELLSRMPLKRLEAESVRDSLLIVAGRLDKRPFGEPDPVTVRADGLVTSTEGELGWRRTIYVQQRRKELPTILETFDLPQMIPNCVSRPSSTVAPQALHLLNNGMVRELAASFAQRVLNESPQNPRRQVERVFEIALSRPPSAEELDEATAALAQLTEQWRVTLADAKTTSRSAEEKALANFCHVVMNSAAFVFVD